MNTPKPRTIHVCTVCGHQTAKWQGKCPGCGEWDVLEERAIQPAQRQGGAGRRGRRGGVAVEPLDGPAREEERLPTGVAEFDRVTGGGLVPGGVVIMGGDPGIGKSTLLMQVAARLAADGRETIYVSGEESVDQVRLRARRLGLARGSNLGVTSTTDAAEVADTMRGGGLNVILVDSVQSVSVPYVDALPGSVSQLKAAANELVSAAKTSGTAVVMVGHMTKDANIAGPKQLEHLVDAVLRVESDPGQQFRIVRATKNRFGAEDEIGVFEMTDAGMKEVANPSELFLNERQVDAPGSAVYAGVEGTRPVLVEIQSLVSRSAFSTPQRTVVGWDRGRLSMVLAVLEARCGVFLSGCDIHVNVSGGFRLTEPAADLAAAASLLSAANDVALPPDQVVFGEIGLGGEVRPVSRAGMRLREAARLGFSSALAPRSRRGDGDRAPRGMSVHRPERLLEIARDLTPGGGATAGAREDDPDAH